MGSDILIWQTESSHSLPNVSWCEGFWKFSVEIGRLCSLSVCWLGTSENKKQSMNTIQIMS